MQNIYEAVDSNKRRSAVIVILFFIFTVVVFYVFANAASIYLGYEPGGMGYVGLALLVSGITSFGSYYFSDKIVLSISGAKPADKKINYNFYTVAENLAISTGLPKPRLYVIDDTAPNAFATGRDPEHAVIVATTGLLSKLSRTELEGVIAHEISHIRNYDIRLMSLVAVLVGTIALMADWFLRFSFRSKSDNRKASQLDVVFLILGAVFALVSPFVAQIIKLAISRRREYLADAGSVAITHQPSGLISALKKIALDREPLEAANKATAHLYIENPFKNSTNSARDWFAGLFNTHPPVEDRIQILEKMS